MRTLSLRSSAGCLALVASCLLVASSGCNSTSGWSRNTIGKRYYSSGDYTAARRSFEQALMNDPWNPNYAFNVAAAMQKQGDHLAAERMYQHALTMNPSHQPSYHALAGMLHENGRTAEAQELLTAWTETQPYVPESHVEMAWMQQQLGDYSAAEASLQQALHRSPRHARAMAQLGQVYEQSGRHADAAALYNRSLAYNRMQPQVAARLNGMQQTSPGLMLAQQMPQYDPLWNAAAPYGAQQFAQTPAYGTQQPYTAFMTPNASAAPMMSATPMSFGLPGNVAQTGFQQMPMQTFAGPSTTQQWVPSPIPAGAMSMTPMLPNQFQSGAIAADPMLTGQTMSFSPAPWIGGGMPELAASQVSSGQPQVFTQTMPTTVTTAPGVQPGVFEAPVGATMVPMYAPQPVQLGTPVPISQHPGSAIPAISAVVPVVPAF